MIHKSFAAFDLALRRLIEPLARFWEVERVFPDTGADDVRLEDVVRGSELFEHDRRLHGE